MSGVRIVLTMSHLTGRMGFTSENLRQSVVRAGGRLAASLSGAISIAQLQRADLFQEVNHA
jgi:hypothetical protein